MQRALTAFLQERQTRLLSRIGVFTEEPEQRGYNNGALRGQIQMCEALLTGEIVSYIEAQTGEPLPDLYFEPYMSPEPEED